MKLIVAGSRDYKNRKRVFELLSKIAIDCIDQDEELTIVSGLARGPDTFGKEWAEKYDIPVLEFPANWDKYGKRAGFIRNDEMAEVGDSLLAFWDGKSPGTKMMIGLAKKKGLKVAVVTE